MADNRTPYWETHIKPMFRRIDRDHMLRFPPSRRIDLFDYDQVVARSKKTNTAGDSVFLLWIHHPMPPANAGGPWPQEWVELFVRWMKADYPRLGRGTATTVSAEDTGDAIILTVEGTTPTGFSAVYMDRISDDLAVRDYEVLFEPTDITTVTPFDITTVTPFEITEAFPSQGVREIWITDSVGRRQVPIA
jgi:hypothetical protein